MKLAVVLALSAIGPLMGCATVPEVTLSAEDRDDCLEAAKPDGNVVMMGWGVCTEYGKLKRMTGVWLHGHELSNFYESERNIPLKFDWVWDEDLDPDSVLAVDPQWILKRLKLPPGKEWCSKAIYLEFEGREGIREVGRQSSDRTRVIMVESVSQAKLIGIVEPTHRGRSLGRCKAERFSS
jgi:hypothetical protein